LRFEQQRSRSAVHTRQERNLEIVFVLSRNLTRS